MRFVEQLEDVVQNAAVGAALFDTQMRYLACSRRWVTDYGLERQPVRGQSHYELFPEVSADWKAVHLRCLAGATESRIHDSFPRRDGRTDVVSWSVHPWYTESGETGGLLILAEKVTERVQLENALQEAERSAAALKASEERFETIFRSSPIPITLTTRNGERRFLDANIAFESATGYRREEVIGHTPEEISIWADPDQRDRAYRQLAASGRLEAFEHQYRAKSGEIRTGLLSIEPVDLDSRRSFIAANVDITDRQRAEEQRDRLQAQLNQVQKMESIGRLAGGIAHDFNNLLTVINGQSKLALNSLPAGSALRHRLEQILKSGERAAGLTAQLLAFSRRQALEARVFDLNQVVTEMRPMLEHLMGDNIEVHLDLHPQALPVFADFHQVERVILNLAVNAREAMPNGGRLRLATRLVRWGEAQAAAHLGGCPGVYALLSVADTGAGMDEATLERIYEPFFSTKAGRGTGLGLAIVQGIVTQSSGYIEVASQPGHGTEFKVYLPLRSTGTMSSEEPAPSSQLAETGTVLVVEDRPEVLAYVTEVLRMNGYRVLGASNPAEALRHSESETKIDLVLTDVLMPGMSGVDLVTQLTRSRPGLKSIFLSGFSNDETLGMLEKGAVFIPKPVSPEELAATVQAVLST